MDALTPFFPKSTSLDAKANQDRVPVLQALPAPLLPRGVRGPRTRGSRGGWDSPAHPQGGPRAVGSPTHPHPPLESSGMRLTALSTSTRSFCSEGRYAALIVTAPYFSELVSR